MRRPLKSELKSYGWTKDVERFKELLADTFAGMFHGTITPEELSYHPKKSAAFVNAIRAAAGISKLSHDFVIGCPQHSYWKKRFAPIERNDPSS